MLKQYILPFTPSRHTKLLSKDFSDQEDRIDFNGLQEQGNAPVVVQNPVNLDQNWLGLLLNSLLPWNNLPQGQGDN